MMDRNPASEGTPSEGGSRRAAAALWLFLTLLAGLVACGGNGPDAPLPAGSAEGTSLVIPPTSRPTGSAATATPSLERPLPETVEAGSVEAATGESGAAAGPFDLTNEHQERVDPTDAETAEPAPTRVVSPEQLLANVTWALGGGGGPGCYGPVDSPLVEITGIEDPTNIPLGARIFIFGCGFIPSEIASAVLHLPGGESRPQMVYVREDGEWVVELWLLPDFPPGDYAFDISTARGIYTVDFHVVNPAEPHMTSGCVSDEEVMAVLTGFVPGEEVLLGRYVLAGQYPNYQGELVGYDFVSIGPAGTATALVPASEFLLAIGQITTPHSLFALSKEEADESGFREYETISVEASAASAPWCLNLAGD